MKILDEWRKKKNEIKLEGERQEKINIDNMSDLVTNNPNKIQEMKVQFIHKHFRICEFDNLLDIFWNIDPSTSSCNVDDIDFPYISGFIFEVDAAKYKYAQYVSF